MEWNRRWRRAGWLLAVPVLTGAAGAAGPLAADLLLAPGNAPAQPPLWPAAVPAVLVGLVAGLAVVWRAEARAAERLRRSEAHYRALASSSNDAALVVDGELRVTGVAPALEPPAGPGRPPLAGQLLVDVVHPDDADELVHWLHDAAAGAPTGLHGFRIPAAAGSWRVLEAGVSDLREDADVRGLVLHCRDVTDRADREHELRALAYTDSLTGLPNCAAQRAALRELLAAQRPDVTLLQLELHGIGEAREALGRAGADAALTEVARRLRATVRADDHVACTGPEQFTVLATGTGDEPDRLADRLLSIIETPIATGTAFVDLTAVVALVPLTGDLTEEQVIDRAELAVADARAAGEGSVRRYRAELGAVRDRRDQLRGDLAGALDRRELTVLWQPVVALEDHRVNGVEALLRWRHPVLGDVAPDEVLAVAERAGLVVALHRWVLREAIAASAQLSVHAPGINIAVNAAPAHVAAGTLVDDVAAALAEGRLPADRLVIELPEEAFELPRATDDVAALRLMGVRLALDDLGGSRPTLSRAGGLPVDIIKLDRSLLARVDRDRHARAVCEAVVGLGAALRVDVVAEGVETAGQLAVLRAMGCGYAQGFLLSRPIPLPVLVELLRSGEGTLWPGAVGGTPAGRTPVLDGAQVR
ncbi:putative bifunctional diguanylate cyclase/phosphodiesterase [Modestobacter marinus]|uniref:putative bifunctional diguanylate cyclase/phosphodiesterase n=1 Tax=Modestobacter marinus TaxID=477641 RepID=UPI001C974E79|nr:EAL domain-containing protein [Modestobacter marinus]